MALTSLRKSGLQLATDGVGVGVGRTIAYPSLHAKQQRLTFGVNFFSHPMNCFGWEQGLVRPDPTLNQFGRRHNVWLLEFHFCRRFFSAPLVPFGNGFSHVLWASATWRLNASRTGMKGQHSLHPI